MGGLPHINGYRKLNTPKAEVGFGFLQVITRPTRVTDHSATIIDHIYTNQIHKMHSCGIITFDISDHLGIYITIALHDHDGTHVDIDEGYNTG